MTAFLLYCRAGYESDLASELEQQSAESAVYGFCSRHPNTAFVIFRTFEPIGASKAKSLFILDNIMFARQRLQVIDELSIDNIDDRISPILDVLATENTVFGDVVVEFADTEEGKELTKFCKKFTVPLRAALRKTKKLSIKPCFSTARLHVFFTKTDQCVVAKSLPNNRSDYHNGIVRLKFPADAPSRSTLKLEEAIQHFLTPEQQSQLLNKNATAVDLGACPGGWTYQLVARRMKVESVDNGKMDEALMATGLVNYKSEDGFKYMPVNGYVDWLVCDMIEKPDKVASLMTDWILRRWTNSCIFNLKLPMKNKYQMASQCIANIKMTLDNANVNYQLQAKHLYHNRDEVTVILVTGSHLSPN